MAQLLKTEGTVTVVTPAKGKKFTLAEAQAFVGGYVEMVRLRKGFMLVDEEGLLKGKVLNMGASGFAGLDLVGDVLLCTTGEF